MRRVAFVHADHVVKKCADRPGRAGVGHTNLGCHLLDVRAAEHLVQHIGRLIVRDGNHQRREIVDRRLKAEIEVLQDARSRRAVGCFQCDALLEIDLARRRFPIQGEENWRLDGAGGREPPLRVDRDLPPGAEMPRIDADRDPVARHH